MTEPRQSDTFPTGWSRMEPGFYRTAETGHPGLWVLHIPAGAAFGLNAVAALTRAAVERPPGPSREVFERLAEAFVAASPDYGE